METIGERDDTDDAELDELALGDLDSEGAEVEERLRMADRVAAAEALGEREGTAERDGEVDDDGERGADALRVETPEVDASALLDAERDGDCDPDELRDDECAAELLRDARAGVNEERRDTDAVELELGARLELALLEDDLLLVGDLLTDVLPLALRVEEPDRVDAGLKVAPVTLGAAVMLMPKLALTSGDVDLVGTNDTDTAVLALGLLDAGCDALGDALARTLALEEGDALRDLAAEGVNMLRDALGEGGADGAAVAVAEATSLAVRCTVTEDTREELDSADAERDLTPLRELLWKALPRVDVEGKPETDSWPLAETALGEGSSDTDMQVLSEGSDEGDTPREALTVALL